MINIASGKSFLAQEKYLLILMVDFLKLII